MNYEYIKSHYKLTSVDLSRQKDDDQKAIQQIEFVE